MRPAAWRFIRLYTTCTTSIRRSAAQSRAIPSVSSNFEIEWPITRTLPSSFSAASSSHTSSWMSSGPKGEWKKSTSTWSVPRRRRLPSTDSRARWAWKCGAAPSVA